jgi:adenosine kinase
MACLVSGSLAFDTITNFPGRFAEQILPEQVHILNVSFLVPTLRREYGGCAGNIAYTLAALGSEAVVVAALGNDGEAYLDRMQRLGIDTRQVLQVEDTYTAQAMIITDADNNQITAFHPGAMQEAHRPRARPGRGEDPLHLRPGPGPADVRRRSPEGLHRPGHLGRGQRLRRPDAVRADRPLARGAVFHGEPEGRDRHAGRGWL